MGSKTFILLKPDALERGLVDRLMHRFFEAGYRIDHIHYRVVDKVLIRKHYEDVIKREGAGFTEWLDHSFVGKPTIPLVLSHERDDGIELAREMLGNRRPALAKQGTIRGDYGIKTGDPNAPTMNLVHASDNREAVEKETRLWFNAPKL